MSIAAMCSRRLQVIVFFLMCLYLIGSGSESIFSSGVELSCLNARSPQNAQGAFCNFISWNAANSYSSLNFSVYTLQTLTPFSASDQDKYAQYLYANLVGNAHDIDLPCAQALQRLACVTAFPECPISGSTGSSASYFTPCKLQCLQADVRCPIKLNCQGYQSKDCMLFIPSGYFVLSPDQGPYQPLPVIYGFVLACWILMAVSWNYLTLVTYKDSCVLLCRAVAGIPVLKVLVLVFATSFWTTCNAWEMCSFWMGVSLINTHLVYETGEMIIFVLVAKGWSLTRETFSPNEWRGVIMIISAFYMANSIVLVLQSSVLTIQGFWVAAGVLYGTMYTYIIISTLKQLNIIFDHIALLSPEMPHAIVGPLLEKRRMYVCFLGLVFLSMCMEVVTHALVSYDGHEIWRGLLNYELSNVVIVACVGYLFRPREHSPFFFMVPARLTDTTTRPIPIIEVDESLPGTDCEVEMAPLLIHADDGVNSRPLSKLVVVRSPINAIFVGVSSRLSASSAVSTPPPPPLQPAVAEGGSVGAVGSTTGGAVGAAASAGSAGIGSSEHNRAGARVPSPYAAEVASSSSSSYVRAAGADRGDVELQVMGEEEDDYGNHSFAVSNRNSRASDKYITYTGDNYESDGSAGMEEAVGDVGSLERGGYMTNRGGSAGGGYEPVRTSPGLERRSSSSNWSA